MVSVSSFSSRSRPSRFTARDWVEPPVMEPPECITSPTRVTKRKECPPARIMAMPLSRSSAMTVRPSRFSTIPRYSGAHCTSSLATPKHPGSRSACRSRSVNSLERTADIGRKVARPKRFCRRKSMSCLAVSSLSVTMFCCAAPSAISMAVSYFWGTEISWVSTPLTPVICRWDAYCTARRTDWL